jgi:hypothetical protein
MYRIHWPDGRVSDLGNLTRAKDAAIVIAQRGPPPRNVKHLLWKCVGDGQGSPLARRNSRGAVVMKPAPPIQTARPRNRPLPARYRLDRDSRSNAEGLSAPAGECCAIAITCTDIAITTITATAVISTAAMPATKEKTKNGK